jgi:hypothetical protein
MPPGRLSPEVGTSGTEVCIVAESKVPDSFQDGKCILRLIQSNHPSIAYLVVLLAETDVHSDVWHLPVSGGRSTSMQSSVPIFSVRIAVGYHPFNSRSSICLPPKGTQYIIQARAVFTRSFHNIKRVDRTSRSPHGPFKCCFRVLLPRPLDSTRTLSTGTGQVVCVPYLLNRAWKQGLNGATSGRSPTRSQLPFNVRSNLP